MMCFKDLAPALYISHGGGPMPLLTKDDPCAVKLRSIAAALKKSPDAILVITAHWAAQTGFHVSAGVSHSLLFDYSGFPSESYNYKYNVNGEPNIAEKVIKSLNEFGIPCNGDNKRGYDHGVFVPLMIMFPDANIPVVAMSINIGLDPSLHLRAGKAIAKLREMNVMIIGSGSSFHNFEYFFARDEKKIREGVAASRAFDRFLVNTLTSPTISSEQREEKLLQWSSAPSALQCHPMGQEEHLIPLHVVVGASLGRPGKHLGSASLRGYDLSFFEF